MSASLLKNELDRRSASCDTVVFDIGNTLLNWDRDQIADRFFPQEHRDVLWHACFVPDHEWHWGNVDEGLLPQEVLAERIAAGAGLPGCGHFVLDAFRGFLALMTPLPLASLLPELKEKGMRLYLLSNYPQPQAGETLRAFSFFRLFDGGVFSADEHLCKPDPRIFRLLTERYGIIPEKALFIDDAPANVQSAQDLGFRVWQDFPRFY